MTIEHEIAKTSPVDGPAINCATCRHWRGLEEGWGVCLRTEVERNGEPIDGETLAYVWGESVDEETALMTHQTFGCVQFEQGEP